MLSLDGSGSFNFGRGAFLNLSGRAELDAAIMSSSGAAGGVSNLTRTSQAIAVARKVMEETPHLLLCGKGADAFAAAMGFPQERIGTPERRALYGRLRRELDNGRASTGRWSDGRPSRHPAWWNRLQTLVRAHPELLHGTVGAVALDARGRLAAATSTGGIFLKMEGRVSDTSLVGCGTYADRTVGAAPTGIGVVFLRHAFSRSVAVRCGGRGETPQRAIERALADLPPDTVGAIALDRRGRVGAAQNTADLAHGWRGASSSSLHVALH